MFKKRVFSRLMSIVIRFSQYIVANKVRITTLGADTQSLVSKHNQKDLRHTLFQQVIEIRVFPRKKNDTQAVPNDATSSVLST